MKTEVRSCWTTKIFCCCIQSCSFKHNYHQYHQSNHSFFILQWVLPISLISEVCFVRCVYFCTVSVIGILMFHNSGFPRIHNGFSFTDSLFRWILLASLLLVWWRVCDLFVFSNWNSVGHEKIRPHFFSCASFFCRWSAEGFTKPARWRPLHRQRRPQRVATDASWAMSLTALCLGSRSVNPPSYSRQLQLRPVSTSPSEQN